MAGIKERVSSERIMKMLDDLDALGILADIPGRNRKKPRIRLPYSSDPRSFEEPWK
jgi:hypothetical protein